MKDRVIFVYNADADFLSQIKDYLHKVFRPQTYPCNLCSLTHSNFGMKDDFRNFIKQFDNFEFLHKDEFQQITSVKNVQLPAIFRQKADDLKVLISAEELNKLDNSADLIELIKSRINA